jgi:hypothetical protein
MRQEKEGQGNGREQTQDGTVREEARVKTRREGRTGEDVNSNDCNDRRGEEMESVSSSIETGAGDKVRKTGKNYGN